MASEDTIVKKLVINDITEEEFEAKKAAGELNPDEIYLTPDKTDEKLAGKVSVAQGKENAGKVLVISENGEVVPGEVAPIEPQTGSSMPILTHIFADHELNDMSWLRADTFSWQSGDVYVAAYEHLASEVVIETETKKYIRVQRRSDASGEYYDDNNIYYREPSYDLSDDIVYDEGYAFAWVAVSSDIMVITNTETPTESDVIYYRSKIYPEDPPLYSGRVVEAGEETFYSNAETETVDGITITFYRAEDGHKICLVDQESNVQAIYEATGVAWYYILDTENKQFKLPRTKHAFTGLRDSVGGYVKAGLPNITGEAGYYLANVGSLGVNIATGAFAKTGSEKLPTATKTGTESTAVNTRFNFDASRSSSVYGNSNTVQPEATQMYLYFYVGNFERDALEQTAGITSEQLNNKADVSDVVELQNNKLDKSAEIYLVPTGSVTAFAGTTPPVGWLKCDGSAISRTTYAKLFAAIGGNYGVGDGSTTFNLPNLQGGRVPVGMSGDYVGQSTNGVLPNITGSLYGAKGDSNPTGTGAIAVYPQNYEGIYGSGGGQYYNWDFNASRSNSMYGNGWFSGEKVIPASVGMTYCIKY